MTGRGRRYSPGRRAYRGNSRRRRAARGAKYQQWRDPPHDEVWEAETEEREGEDHHPDPRGRTDESGTVS
jgi:hypothetical protein